jgi:hypothetical protein
MKNLFVLTAGTALLLTLAFCKNTPLPEGQTMVSENTPIASAPETPVQMSSRDSVAGFEGCDRATWSPLTTNSEQFIYQNYTVKITRNPNKPGDNITVKRDAGRADFVVPTIENAHFKGVSRNKLFVESGTGTDDRHLYVYDIDKRLMFFDTPYCGEIQIVHSDRLYFMMPVVQEEVTRIPDCPEKEQWIKDGLQVGYGQRCIFNLLQRSLTRKSEWACVPVQ